MGFPIREANLVGTGLTAVSGTSTGTGATTDISDLDEAWVAITGTFVGTVQVQISMDGGTTWSVFQSITTAVVSNQLPACKRVRAVCSAFTSGTILASVSGRNKAPGIS